MSKKILIVSATKGVDSESLLFKTHIKNLLPLEFFMVQNNKDSLASVYNRYLTEKYRDYIVCFVHDDVCIDDRLFISKIEAAIKKYDVFGVAGGSGSITIQPNQPALWHLISEKKVGFAGHYDTQSKIDDVIANCWVTTFGSSPDNATLLDGVFLCVNVEKVLEKGVKFDENCPAKFHFYDLLFSVNAKKAGLKLGVVPVVLFHRSHGLTEVTQDFLQGDQYFKNYCSKLNDRS